MNAEPPGQPPPWPPPPPPPSEPPDVAQPPGHPPPAPRRRRSKLIALVAFAVGVVVVLAAVGAYAVVGAQVASSRISAANSAIDKTESHQSNFEHSMGAVSQDLGGFSSSDANPTQYKAAIDQFVKTAQQEQNTAAADRSSLDAASRRLHDSEWLTLFSKGSLDHAAARIGHAEAALAIARTMSADLTQDGAFFEAFADSLIDLDNVGTQSQAANFSGALSAVAKLKSDADRATSLANAPGMPDELHQLMVDFENLATDFQDLFNAAIAGDANAMSNAKAKGDADLAALKSIDLTTIGTKIAAFYQPMASAYKQDLQAASS